MLMPSAVQQPISEIEIEDSKSFSIHRTIIDLQKDVVKHTHLLTSTQHAPNGLFQSRHYRLNKKLVICLIQALT